VSTELRLFGPLSVIVNDRRLGPRDFGGRKAKQVLEILALSQGRLVSKDRLIH
jgi:DNA-binding SARP family transcriptional activator